MGEGTFGSLRTTPTGAAHWAAVFANKDFVESFASKFRPLVMTEEVKLLQAAAPLGTASVV